MNSKWWFVVFFGLAFIALECTSKHVAGFATLTSGRVTQLSKFSFRPGGTAVINGTFQYRGPEPRGSIYLFMDTTWEQYHLDNDHCSRMNAATAKIRIGSSMEEFNGKGWVDFAQVTDNDSSDLYAKSYSFSWKIDHFVRTYGYYLVIGDCDSAVASKKFLSVKYAVDFFNFDTDHFPADEHGLYTLHVICLVMLVAFALKHHVFKPKTTMREHTPPSTTPTAAITLLYIAYAAEVGAIFLELLHLTSYWSNGKGIFVFDFFSEVCEGMAQFTLAYLLLAFAGGWTLIEGSITKKSDGAINPEQLGEDHAATLFVSLMSLFSILLQLLNKLVFADDFAKFHDHDTWPGLILVCMRAFLALFFTKQCWTTLQFMKNKRGKKDTQTFLFRLALWGGLWFWIFPLLVLISNVFAHYLRHRVVSGGVLFLQTTSLLVLSRQILSTQSAYNKASIHGGTILGDSWGKM